MFSLSLKNVYMSTTLKTGHNTTLVANVSGRRAHTWTTEPHLEDMLDSALSNSRLIHLGMSNTGDMAN
ncbi:hypothetical protein DdX_14793 [Ditylenchus destructor]|uniref:Uncharacterized protein n=1 Tax=Ditylenchus destructor TaxID=166010 RepID=A0AAD4MTF6_9BILA|nr:hypothetical protein DdX_14793 [Ditylenchus destructor]